MKKYSAEIIIRAPPQKVWAALVDVVHYPEWDPGMLRIEGRIAPGERVKFFTKLSPDQAFPVKVTGFEPPYRIVMTGGMPFGLFKSERTHSLSPAAGGGTRFRTEEVFSGPLLGVFGKNIPDLTGNFEQFAAGLKQRAESLAA